MKLIFTIEKIQNDQVTLKEASGKLINWPKDLLPDNVKEKDQINFDIGEDNNLAKNILNEILQTP